MFDGMRYLVARFIQRRWRGPRSGRKYDSQTRAFTFRSPNGLRFELHPNQYIDRQIALNGIFEDRLLDFLASKLTRDSVVVDIGANIGNHALFLARKCAVVHCFEPNPRALKRLDRNIALNGATNVIVHPYALGDRTETRRFFENSSDNLGASSFIASSESANQIDLEIRQADQAMAELNLSRLDLIKVDVEGMEESVFRGLQETLQKFNPIIGFEFLGSKANQSDYDRLRGLLKHYKIFEPSFSPTSAGLLKRVLWTLERAGKPDLTPVENVEPRDYESLIAVPIA